MGHSLRSVRFVGLTWIFGYLAIDDARLVFQYLFCITNAFQGLVIFILHNIRDTKVSNTMKMVDTCEGGVTMANTHEGREKMVDTGEGWAKMMGI